MKLGDRIEVRNWKAVGWEGRQGLVILITKKVIVIRFDDWSDTDVNWPVADANVLHVIA